MRIANLIRMKEFFREYTVRVWVGVNMSSDKYRELNKSVTRKCIEFYARCQKYRNNASYDEERQKKQVKNKFVKKREKALNSDAQQVRDYARKFAINKERSDMEKLQKQIMSLKKLEKRVEKYLETKLEYT